MLTFEVVPDVADHAKDVMFALVFHTPLATFR